MRVCRRLVGDDDDATALLAIARKIANRRVVVKRHRHAAPLAPDASVTYKGTVVRYDAYVRTGNA
ncbi:MAG: class I SAM-dependent methyltransferase, partial [Planctomycetes bacterium]|nr:class I SAM-dependent methyltransferase [Planctomycetota bacterium]